MRGEHMPPWHQPSRRDALRIGAFGSLAGAMGLASGCGSDAGASAVRTLRIAQQSEPTGLDPHLESGLDAMNVLINIFDTLTMRDTDNQLVPRLATEWEAVDDLRWRDRKSTRLNSSHVAISYAVFCLKKKKKKQKTHDKAGRTASEATRAS